MRSLEDRDGANEGLRPVVRIVAARRTLEGEGFEVRRPFPGTELEALGPFIFLDHVGPTDYGPGEAKGAPTHPHAGFETLTYLLEGRGMHRDSIGNANSMIPGEAQWMRAGAGIVHDEGPDEAFRRSGGRRHGVQLWINLPRGLKQVAPAYRHLRAGDIPVIERDGGAVRIKLLAGALDGQIGPVETFAMPWLAHVRLAAGAATVIDLPADIEAGSYVLAGAGRFGPAAVEAAEGQLVLFAAGTGSVALAAGDGPLDMLVLGGPPLDADLVRYGPFVMNTVPELEQAVRDYRAGRFGEIDHNRPFTA